MKRENEVLRLALLRRRIHKSWKFTLLVALAGVVVFCGTGMVSGWAAFVVLILLFLTRPVAELIFSRKFFCPRCEADIFLEVCLAESRGRGVEHGVRCSHCGADATEREMYRELEGVVDVD